MSESLHHLLRRELVAILRRIGEMAAEAGMEAYLVGGPVRDALLGLEVADVDVAVVGDARKLAEAVARETHGRVALHEEFWTATVKLPDGSHIDHIDLATARRERYKRPGALPSVDPAGILEDLRRRDFTVNAMAMALAPDSFGRLLDPTGGRNDLRRRLLRAISATCFVDDATRVVRAAVYVEKLDLQVEEETDKALRAAVAGGFMETVTPQRHGEQLRRGLMTRAAGRILLRLAEWGALEHLGLPARPLHPAALADVAIARERLGATAEEVAAAAVALVGEDEAAGASLRLGLGRHFAAICRELGRAVRDGVPEALADAETLGAIERLLRDYSPATHVALWAMAGPAVRARLEAWRVRRADALKIDGRDIIAAGVPQGPAVGEGLRAATEAALDGLACDADSQLAVAVDAARRWAEGGREARSRCGGKQSA